MMNKNKKPESYYKLSTMDKILYNYGDLLAIIFVLGIIFIMVT